MNKKRIFPGIMHHEASWQSHAANKRGTAENAWGFHMHWLNPSMHDKTLVCWSTLRDSESAMSIAKRICYDKQQNTSLPVYCPKRRNFKYRCAIRAWDASISAMATNLWSLLGLWVKCAKLFSFAHETSWSMNSQLVRKWRCHHCCSLHFNSKPGLSNDLALLRF